MIQINDTNTLLRADEELKPRVYTEGKWYTLKWERYESESYVPGKIPQKFKKVSLYSLNVIVPVTYTFGNSIFTITSGANMTQAEYDAGLAVIDEIVRHLPSDAAPFVKTYKEHYIEKNKSSIPKPVTQFKKQSS
jgi:hypothetical protein